VNELSSDNKKVTECAISTKSNVLLQHIIATIILLIKACLLILSADYFFGNGNTGSLRKSVHTKILSFFLIVH